MLKKIAVLGALSISCSIDCSISFAQESKPYVGSSFNEIVSILRDEQIKTTSNQIENELKIYRSDKFTNYYPDAAPSIVNDARRTLTDQYDHYDRLEKRIHGNGICFTGKWKMYNNSPYSGYFQSGKEALFVGRVSVTTDKTLSGQIRTFGFVGKIFPTTDQAEVVKTVNFFTVDYLFGSKVNAFTETTLTNEPHLFSNVLETDWEFIGRARKMGQIFGKVNKKPTFRPVTPIANLGLLAGETVVSPKFISISTLKNFNYVPAEGTDFREELNLKNYPHGLVLIVKAGNDKKKLQPIGSIRLEESFVSYGCDRQLHFAHPRVD